MTVFGSAEGDIEGDVGDKPDKPRVGEPWIGGSLVLAPLKIPHGSRREPSSGLSDSPASNEKHARK